MRMSYSERKKAFFLKKFPAYSVVLFLLVLFSAIWAPRLIYLSELDRLSEDTVSSPAFRRQEVGVSALEHIRSLERPGEYLAVYWLENGFGSEPDIDSPEEIESKRKRWERLDDWSPYLRACQAVWDDLAYFPVADCKDKDLSVTFENSWMFERSYNGDRVHEGTDLMPSVNERETFPIVSMTDGVVEQMGWLELGGWRIGIRAPHGGYFYYAHLSSYADLEVGDTVRAGDFLGYMGDTGYSTKEGTTGKFPVHLHLGIYLNTDTGEEISVNPYPALKYTEENKISFKGFHTL